MIRPARLRLLHICASVSLQMGLKSLVAVGSCPWLTLLLITIIFQIIVNLPSVPRCQSSHLLQVKFSASDELEYQAHLDCLQKNKICSPICEISGLSFSWSEEIITHTCFVADVPSWSALITCFTARMLNTLRERATWKWLILHSICTSFFFRRLC